MRVCRFLLIIVISATMAMILVWERNQITRIGYEVSILKKRKEDLIEVNMMLEHKIKKLATEDRIVEVIKSMDLNLVLSGKVEDRPRRVSMKNNKVNKL